MQEFSYKLAFYLTAVSVMVLSSASAHATEGYFQHGYGARSKALGGAGAADSHDATATSLNPAGLVHVEDQADIAVSVFSPHREFEGGPAAGPTFTPIGTVESNSNYFLVPNLAVSYRLAPNPFADVIGVSLYGNGGMNTDYPAVARAFPPGATGVFLGGNAGVNLQHRCPGSCGDPSRTFDNLIQTTARRVERSRQKARGFSQASAARHSSAR